MFLTSLDSRAQIKGSRDPLGLGPVWGRFGRGVVGNLSTVSDSVRGFTTLLLGYYFAEQIQAKSSGDQETTLSTFLKFEQLAGYVRLHFHKDGALRGIERVRKRLSEGTTVVLGLNSESQILGNQKIYGLWGLFSVPARTSGFLTAQTLTPEARSFVEGEYIGRLSASGVRVERDLLSLLGRDHPRVALAGQHASLCLALSKLLGPRLTRPERDFYETHLVEGGPVDNTQGRQTVLADLLGRIRCAEFGIAELEKCSHLATKASNPDLARRLLAIRDLELLLVPMANAFAFMLSRDRQKVDSVSRELRSTWGPTLRHVDDEAINELQTDISEAYSNADAGARLVKLAVAFREGEYKDALGLLLEHNAFVMNARNGSRPWARSERGTLHVRYRDETDKLISRSELPTTMRNTYFIASLNTVQRTVREA